MTQTVQTVQATEAPAPVESLPAPPTGSRRWRLGPTILVPAAAVGVLAIAAIAPGFLASGDPLAMEPANAFAAPSLDNLFGTDESGRDVFTRVIHGARDSLSIGLMATVIGVGLGLILGAIAGWGSKAVDFSVNRVLEVLFAFPNLLLALLVITILGPGVVTLTLAVGLSTAPGYARMIRSQVRSVKASGYVEASIVQGRSRWFIIRRHVLPNVAAPLFVLATLGVGQAIVWASSLSFLGLGATPPAPEWGAMLSDGRGYMSIAWWITVFPGLFIVLSAAATTVLGHSLQKRQKEQS